MRVLLVLLAGTAWLDVPRWGQATAMEDAGRTIRSGAGTEARDTGDLAEVDESERADTDEGEDSNALAGGTDQDLIDDARRHPGVPFEGGLG